MKKVVCGVRGRIPGRWRKRRNLEVAQSRRGERGSGGLALTYSVCFVLLWSLQDRFRFLVVVICYPFLSLCFWVCVRYVLDSYSRRELIEV